jgi:DNA-binding response OmpR family regulator
MSRGAPPDLLSELRRELAEPSEPDVKDRRHEEQVRRTLVVESDTTVADSVASVLRIAGHFVDVATTSGEARTRLRRHRYRLVVTNLGMPGLDGPTLYEELARSSPEAFARVIFITQSAFVPQYSRFLMEVAAPLLVNPIHPADLWESVERLLPRPPF